MTTMTIHRANAIVVEDISEDTGTYWRRIHVMRGDAVLHSLIVFGDTAADLVAYDEHGGEL